MKYKVVRDVTIEECNWLSEDILRGTEVYEYNGYTYGCVSNNGIACSDEEDKTPFFEMPYDSLQEIS